MVNAVNLKRKGGRRKTPARKGENYTVPVTTRVLTPGVTV